MISFFIFLISATLSFIIPGTIFLHSVKRPFLEKFILGVSVGMAFWVIQSYILGLLGLRILSYLYILFCFLIFMRLYVKSFKKLKLQTFKIDFLTSFIIIFGTILNLSAVWFIGVHDSEGYFMCCRGVPDAIYHLSLTNQIINNFPPFEPGMSGVAVKNYHFLSNLVSADISRMFGIDFVDVQFRFMSLLLGLLLGGTGFVLCKIIGLNKFIARVFLIFLYGSGDILYLLLLLRGKGINFDVTIIDDASKLLAGPPRAFSIVILLCGLSLFCLWIKKRALSTGILMGIVMGVLVGFKVYTGIFALSGLGAIGFYYLKKRDYRMIFPPILSLLIALAYYFPNNKGAGGLFFNGVWRFENFMQHKDLAISKLDFLRIEMASENRIFEVLLLELLFVALYFTFLFGTTMLALLQNKQTLRLLPKELNIFLIAAISVSLVAGSFFYQQTGGANTVQFLISVFIIASLYAAISIYHWTRTFIIPLKIFVLGLILFLTTSRSFYEVFNNFIYIANKKGYRVTLEEYDALTYLSRETAKNSQIIVDPFRSEDEPFMYISFLSNREVFLSGAGVLRDHGQDTKYRENTVKTVFTSNKSSAVVRLLKENGVDYVYVHKDVNFNSDNNYFKKVFDNKTVRIYEVI